MDMLIVGAEVIGRVGVIDNGAVLVEGDRIRAVGPVEQVRAEAPSGVPTLDAPGLHVLPGLIDLQINGAGGRLFIDEPTAETLSVMSTVLARMGCTAFLPTALSAPLDRLAEAASSAARAAVEPESAGARVLGCHLEDPFINPERAGAHDLAWIRPPSLEDLRALLDAGDGWVRIITLAPELPGALEVIREARRRGAVVALGHTNATLEEAQAGIAAGASIVTHLFNAMAPLLARAPGVIGAALASDGPFAGIIVDGISVHPANVALAVRNLGPDRTVLLTDAMPPMGTDMTTYEPSSPRILVRDGACYLEDGTLAGSMLTMLDAVRNVIRMAGVSLPEAVAMASSNPARVLGIHERTGSLAVGLDADLVVCDDDLNVLLTMVEGRVVFRSPVLETARL